MANSRDTGMSTDPQYTKKCSLNKGDTIALKDFLEKRLVDCGWRKKIEDMIRSKLEECGASNITHQQLAEMIVPNARALVPSEVRVEMLTRVREALQCPLPLPNSK